MVFVVHQIPTRRKVNFWVKCINSAKLLLLQICNYYDQRKEFSFILRLNLLGFPPKVLESANNEKTLKLCGISNGETLIVDEKPLTQEEKDQIENMKRLLEDEELAKQLANPGANGILLKHVVPADNSCLFTSIGFVMNGKVWKFPFFKI